MHEIDEWILFFDCLEFAFFGEFDDVGPFVVIRDAKLPELEEIAVLFAVFDGLLDGSMSNFDMGSCANGCFDVSCGH